jgi:carbon storage regulator
MLILKRQPGESIWIGNDIQVTVLSNVNGTTRIGITAPQKINIFREELRNTEKAHAAIAKTY